MSPERPSRRPASRVTRRARADSASKSPPEQPSIGEWTPLPFIPGEQVRHLLASVEAAALDGRELLAFQGVVHRAFEDLYELEQLYEDVPGVLGDDPAAVGHFAEVLSGLRDRGFDPSVIREAARHPLANKPFPDGDLGMPCKPTLAVGPSIVFAIGMATDRLWGPDREGYARSIDDIAGLWEGTRPLEDLFSAAQGAIEGRPDDLRGTLRRFVRDTRGKFLTGARGEYTAPPPGAGSESKGGLGGIGGIGNPSVLDDLPFGDPPGTWPPIGGGRIPPNLCELMPDLCKGMVYGGLRRMQFVPISTNANGITGLQPSTSCAGQQVTIVGSGFGASQPADVDVIIGTTVATVVSWSGTAIVITVPAGAKSGCVGFRNRTLEEQRLNAMLANQEAMAEISEGLHCLGVYQTGGWNVPVGPSTIPCTAGNFLRVGPPAVASFLVNNLATLEVTPGMVLTLTWSVSNTTSVQIRRTSTAGPFIDQVFAPTGTFSLGPFNGTQPVTATYVLTATNTCGNTSAQVTVQLAQPPNIGVVAIEVAQSIQTMTNSVRLVAGKRTIARVWVDSGIINGFNNGVGANQIAITGRLSITPAGGASVSAGPVLNAGGTINAQPAAAFNRSIFNHSLNFELPLGQLTGAARLDVTVFVPGREGQPGYTATGSTTVTFLPQVTQQILPFLVTDSIVGGTTNAGQFAISLAGATTRQPIALIGFVVNNPPIPVTTNFTEDLRGTFGWGMLVTRLATMIFLFPNRPVGGIRTAIVPNNGAYAVNGMALPRQLISTPAFIARATLPATYAHEMCHLAGIDHAPCGGPPTPIDPRLPGTIEDVAMDVPTRTITPAGTGELMSLCGGQARWPSIANYNGIMFTAFPI